MKKTIKYLVFSLLMLFGFSLNVNAETLPAAKDGKITLDKDYTIESTIFDSTSDVSVIDLNGKTLTLSNTKPTRSSIDDNGTLTTYTFKGWATSASSTSVAYAAGASYTANAAITLYAVWSKTISRNIK